MANIDNNQWQKSQYKIWHNQKCQSHVTKLTLQIRFFRTTDITIYTFTAEICDFSATADRIRSTEFQLEFLFLGCVKFTS